MTSTERVSLHRNRKKAEVFSSDYMDSAKLATVEEFLKGMINNIEVEQDVVVECIAQRQLTIFNEALLACLNIDGQYSVKDLFIAWHQAIAIGKGDRIV